MTSSGRIETIGALMLVVIWGHGVAIHHDTLKYLLKHMIVYNYRLPVHCFFDSYRLPVHCFILVKSNLMYLVMISDFLLCKPKRVVTGVTNILNEMRHRILITSSGF